MPKKNAKSLNCTELSSRLHGVPPEGGCKVLAAAWFLHVLSL